MFENDIDWPLRTEACLILMVSGGTRYTNQSGCGFCNHPEVTGNLLVLPTEVYDEIEKLHIHATSQRAMTSGDMPGLGGITLIEADKIDTILPSNVRVDRAKILESEEAWIFVNVKLGDVAYEAVLVYPNCD